MTVFTKVKKEDLLHLKDFIELGPKTIYEELRLQQKEVTLILYTSEKLLLQGKKEAVDKIAEQLEKKGIGERVEEETFRKETGTIIGSDEALKGDTFGGMVIAAVKADDALRQKLIEMGVADSKTLSDKEIMFMAEKIKKIAQCEIKSLLPEEFNHEDKVTEMLNKYHAQVAEYLKPGKHVVDKYPGCIVGDIAEEKAESKYVEVAAASVLARATALKQLDFLSSQAGFTFPKEIKHVKDALLKLKEKGLDAKKFVKLNFRNVQEILG